jgi:hypothetical protein
MSVRAQEDGAHSIAIDAQANHDNAKDETADRYCFLVKVVDDTNPKYVLTEYYFVAKVQGNIRGHTNANKIQPINGGWKVIGKFTEDNDHKKPFDIPPTGMRGWANKKGELYAHDCSFSTNTYDIDVRCGDIDPQQLNFYYPELIYGCAGQYSAAIHHTTVTQFNSRYSIYTQNDFVRTINGKPLSPEIIEGEKEFFSRLSALWLKVYGEHLHASNIQRFSVNKKQAVIFSASPLYEIGEFLYVDGAQNLAMLWWKGSSNVDAGIISVNTSGTMITFPIYPPLDTSRDFIKRYYEEGTDCYNSAGYGDNEMTSFYRAKAARAWSLNSGKFYGYSNTPVIINMSISVSEDGTLTVSNHESTSIKCNIEADVSNEATVDSYSSDAESTLEFSGRLFAYRGDSLVSEYVNSTYTTIAKYRSVSAKYAGAGPAEYNIRSDQIGPLVAYCEGKDHVAFSTDPVGERTVKVLGQYFSPGSFEGSSYAYDQSSNVKFNDAWSSYDLTIKTLRGSGAVQGTPCEDDGFSDQVEIIVSYIGMSTAPEYGIIEPTPKYLITTITFSMAAPEEAVFAGYAESKIAAYTQAAHAASDAVGGVPVSTYECETTSSTESVLMASGCDDTYGNIIDVKVGLLLSHPPTPTQKKKKLNLRAGFNLVTNSTGLLHDDWVNDGVYGLDSAVGIFDPMLGVVERMFSGYTKELQQKEDNIRLHLLEVKYHANATPVSIVKAETMPPHHWSESSALDSYPRSTYCGYIHEHSARSTVCISYGRTFEAKSITPAGLDDYQSACIVDGDNGDVIDILAVCGLKNTNMIYSLDKYPQYCFGRFYDVSICVIPKELIKEDWPRP